MWDYFFTSYILGTAILFFLGALAFILPSLLFKNKVMEEKVGVLDEKRDVEKLRIDKRAKFYQEKFRQL